LLRKTIGLKLINNQRLIAHYYIRKTKDIKVKPGSILFDSFYGQKVGGDPYSVYKEWTRRYNGLIVWVIQKSSEAPDDVKNNTNVVFVEYVTKNHAEALLYCETLVFNMN